jgi:phage tail-like protein
LTLDSARSEAAITEVPGNRWRPMTTFRTTEEAEVEALIVSPPGRYLWLRLTLEGDGAATPTISLIDIAFPRISLRRYLPAIFGTDPQAADFTDRLLAIFDHGLRDIERQIDKQPGLYDPLATPAERLARGRPDFLSWLAAWIGVHFDATMSIPERRRLLAGAGRLMPCTGTYAGLHGKLLLLLGIDPDPCPQSPSHCGPACPKQPPPADPPPLILEHFRLRRWLELGAATLGDRAVIWGEKLVNRTRLGRHARLGSTRLKSCRHPKLDPWTIYAHRLTVFLPAALLRSDARRTMVEHFIARELPAHVEAEFDYVEPRFRIGIQSSIGFDSVVGCWPAGVTLGTAELGRATVLEASPDQGAPPHRVVRLGQDSRLR